MTKRSMLSVLAMAAVLASGSAMAADTPAPKPAAPGEPQVQRVVIRTSDDSADFEDMDELGWLEDDGDEFVVGAGEEGGAGGPGVQREVIVRRMGGPGAGGPGGMMMMHGGAGGPGGPGGAAGCGDANCGGECGGHGGMGGPGMHAGMGMGMGHPGMGMGRGKGHPAMMFAMLDLTDAQKAKMRDIHENAARTQIQARADMQIARMDMAKLMRADRPDQGAINAQIDKMAQMRASMQKTRVATMLEARAQLTPDQLKKLKEMREKGPMGGHPGMGMGGHPGMGGMMHPGMGAGPGADPHGPAGTPKPKGK